MTYCTPLAVQEQILKRKLAASGCAVTLNKDRPVAATRRPALLDVPDDILLILLGYSGASSLLALETASRALLQLLRSPARHKQQESLWCGCLRARWPCEGPALCSLGDHERRLGLRPRAPARQIYRAFCTKKDAERHIDTVDLEGGEDALEELAFIAVVGGFAGVPSWREEIQDDGEEKVDLLRWQPPSGAVRLGVFENLGAGLTGATVAELTGDRLRQELHVIDLRTFQCVTLLSMVPNNGMDILDSPLSQLPELQDDDAVFFTTSQNYAMRDRRHLRTNTLCSLFPFLALRPTQDGHCLMFAEFVLENRTPSFYLQFHESNRPQFIGNDEGFCDFVAEIIRQTHNISSRRDMLHGLD